MTITKEEIEAVPVPGFVGISADADGSIYHEGVLLKPYMTDKGYLRVSTGGGETHAVHRLVAMAFLAPDNERPEVNHLDGQKDNNRALNLVWATRSENMLHAYSTGLHPGVRLFGNDNGNYGKKGSLHPQSLPVRATFSDGTYRDFECIEAVAASGFSPSKVSRCLHGGRKTHGGAIWRPLPTPPDQGSK